VDVDVRWADAPYQYLADQKAVDLSFALAKGAGSVTVSQRVDSLQRLGCTGAVVWDGAVVMARCLESWDADGTLPMAGMRVVELGAGCGLTGCVAAALGAHVILTDQVRRRIPEVPFGAPRTVRV